MRKVSTLIAVAAVVGAAASVFRWGPSLASSFSGGGTIETAIVSAPRLEATVSTEPGTWLAVAGDSTGTRLQAEVTGPAAGPVTVDGTVALGSATVAALNGRFCVPGGQRKEGVAGTVVGIPPIPGDGGTGAFPGRTSISLLYREQAGSGFLSCYADGLSDGGVPDCTLPTAGATTQGFEIDEGGTHAMEISDAYVLRCIHCANDGTVSGTTVVVSYVEMDCNQ